MQFPILYLMLSAPSDLHKLQVLQSLRLCPPALLLSHQTGTEKLTLMSNTISKVNLPSGLSREQQDRADQQAQGQSCPQQHHPPSQFGHVVTSALLT